MATTSNPLDAIASMLDPSLQVNQMAIDRQRALAAALQQQSMTPADGQMVSGHYVAPSWTQFAGKVAQGLSGKSMNDQLDQQQIAYNRQTMQAMAQLLQGGGQQAPTAMPGQLGSGMMGDVAPQNGKIIPDQPAPATTQGGNGNFDYANILKSKIIGALGGEPAASAFWKQYDPTEATKMAMAAGTDPRQANADALFKNNYVAPVNARAGSILRDPKTNRPMAFNPTIPEGGTPVFDASGNVVRVDPIQGVTGIVSALAAAKQAGTNQETVAPKDILPTNPDGTVNPRSINATLHPPANQGFPAGANVPSASNPQSIIPGHKDSLSILQQERANATKPADIAALDREIARQGGNTAPQGVGAKFGQQQGAEYGQKEMSNSFDALKTDNRQAQTTISYLQSIKSLADKAGVGGFSDKTQLTNNLLSYAGISEKATDSVSAKNLLDKYSNQITARLGGGSNGSDARSAIIAAAYPNSKMTPAAIKEAVDNLVSANQMTQAKAQLLTPHGNARDPVAYSQKEQIFDKNADPRIWQYKSIQDPKARAAFASKIMQQDPQFPAKIQALEKIGAF